MKKILFALSICFFISPALAGGQGKDFKRLNSLFRSAEMQGPQLIKCGREADQKRMYESVSFLETAYQKLNNEFPTYEPPLHDQLQERFNIVCKTIECYKKEPKSSLTASCGWKTDAGGDWIMEPFDKAVTDAKKRLARAGLSVESDSPSAFTDADSCSKSAQYYQDAYVKNFRISDLQCFKTVLERSYK